MKLEVFETMDIHTDAFWNKVMATGQGDPRGSG